MMSRVWFVLLCCWCVPVHAHPLDPAFLQVREIGDGKISLHWSGSQDFVRRVQWRLPGFCRPHSDVLLRLEGRRWLGSRQWQCDTPTLSGAMLTGAEVIDGGELMLDYRIRNQVDSSATLVSVRNGTVTLPNVEASTIGAGIRFVSFGIEHIWIGIDHLMFVFFLLLLFKARNQLLLAVTAFTLGHSITLFLCTMEWLQVPSAWAESCIALSLVFLCRELVLGPDRSSLLSRHPWLVTLLFGLVHGLGFAGALQELGLGKDHLIAQVLGFNLGVEIGQLLFIAASLSLLYLKRTFWRQGALQGWQTSTLLTYLSGVLTCLWFFERLFAGLPGGA